MSKHLELCREFVWHHFQSNRVKELVSVGVEKQKLVIGIQIQAISYELASDQKTGLYSKVSSEQGTSERLKFFEVQ